MFLSLAVAKAVCEIRRHKIGDQEVDVKLCYPPKPRPNYQKKLLFQNVPEGVDRDLLQLFLESVTGCKSEEIIFGDDEGVVLATFDSEPGLPLNESVLFPVEFHTRVHLMYRPYRNYHRFRLMNRHNTNRHNPFLILSQYLTISYFL